ncbi:MAG: hypothetical protein IT258_02800 [Saprospiraceae bacterium]|nr:hypothetical protein [Saprospiraceae bacterium]
MDKPLQRTTALYNQFYFNGQSLLNLSLDYGLALRNVFFFGETARSRNGAIATVNGLVAALDRKVDVAVVLRNFARDYQSLNAKPFAETSGGLNEKGAYFGLQVQPTKRWRLNAYYDQWRHDWLRFGVDAPSNGNEWLGRVTFTQRKKMEAYVQLRSEKKEENYVGETPPPIDRLTVRHNLQGRLHLALKLANAVEWRSRLDLGSSESSGKTIKGVSMYQEFIIRPVQSPFTASTRFALFSTGGYDVRFYSYERDVLNDFSIPAYYDRGSRVYFNLGYRLSKQFRIELRYANFYYPNVKTVGTGSEATTGNRKSEVKVQVRGEF